MPLHNTAAEHHQKLMRVLSRLENEEVHRDDVDDFMKTAYHLIENIEKDPSSTSIQKMQATALRNDADIETAREITNKQKHFKLSPKSHPSPKIQKAKIEQGYGVGRFGMGGYGVGEQSITIEFNDGTTRNVLDLVRSIAGKFAPIFP